MDGLNSAQVIEEHAPSIEASVSGSSSLSVKQKAFALAYVINGGKAREAAVEAGYGEAGAHVAANRCLVNPRVGAEIQKLCRSLINTALPTAIRTLVEIITDKDVKPDIRRKAANDLLERGGIQTGKAGVQVNVGVAVNGQRAQQLITEVWNARTERMSDIPTAMPDNLRTLSDAIDELESVEPTGDGAGGDRPQGPPAGVASLPPPSSAKPSKSEISCECEKCRSIDVANASTERWFRGGGSGDVEE